MKHLRVLFLFLYLDKLIWSVSFIFQERQKQGRVQMRTLCAHRRKKQGPKARLQALGGFKEHRIASALLSTKKGGLTRALS